MYVESFKIKNNRYYRLREANGTIVQHLGNAEKIGRVYDFYNKWEPVISGINRQFGLTVEQFALVAQQLTKNTNIET